MQLVLQLNDVFLSLKLHSFDYNAYINVCFFFFLIIIVATNKILPISHNYLCGFPKKTQKTKTANILNKNSYICSNQVREWLVL